MTPLLQCRTPTDPATGLTRRQRDVLRYWRTVLLSEQRPPTVREISAAFSISWANGSHSHLLALRQAGYLLPGLGRARCWRLAGLTAHLDTRSAPCPDGLPRLQRAVYEMLLFGLVQQHCLPGVHQLAAAFGHASPTAAQEVLRTLEKKGFLVHRPGPQSSSPYRLAGVELSLVYDATDAGRRARLALED